MGLDPRSIPGTWARWDADSYLKIATDGYVARAGFMPGYALFIWVFSIGSAALMPWVGFLISNVAFVLAGVILWRQVELDLDQNIAWATVISLSFFPTSFFFSAIYSESLFLLLSILVYWFSARKLYILAGLCVTFTSVTRVYGILLVVIPLVEMLAERAPRWRIQAMVVALISAVGLSLFELYQWVTMGTPFAFLNVEQEYFKRSVSVPGQPLLDSLGLVLWGYGGFQNKWLTRLGSLQDLLAIGLFIVCSVLACLIIKRKSLVIYQAITTLALSASHGPYTLGVYSMSRYVIVLFPGFIVMGILLEHMPRFKWVTWVVSFMILCFETAWFASGRWIA